MRRRATSSLDADRKAALEILAATKSEFAAWLDEAG